MFEEFVPSEKVARHGAFKNNFIIVISYIASMIFANTLIIGSIVYHLYHKITGKEKFYEPAEALPNGFLPREDFPDVKNMKISTELRYYALALGLDLEEYTITTDDGYVLPLYRLIDPKVTDIDNRKPILLQHGLLGSAGNYLTTGFNSLAYHFLELGYDVWLGNNRCFFEPKHTLYEKNLMSNEAFWDWDIRVLAYYDLPCIIDNVLAHKPLHSKLVLTGHSQGCLQTFMLLRNQNFKAYHAKIEHFIALTPAIFPGKMFHHRFFIKFIHNLGPTGYLCVFGNTSFLRFVTQIRHYIGTTWLFGKLTYFMFKFLFGWSARNWTKAKRVWRFNFQFMVTYVSARHMSWWLSYYIGEGFTAELLPKKDYATGANYKYVPEEDSNIQAQREKASSKSFLPFNTEWFNDPNQTVVPMTIFVGDDDYLVDGKRLLLHMQQLEPLYNEDNLQTYELEHYSHLDAIWARDVIGRIGMVVTDILEQSSTEFSEKNQSAKVPPQPTAKDPLLTNHIDTAIPIVTPPTIKVSA